MSEKKIRKLKDKAIKLLEKGKEKKALAVYNQIMELDNKDISIMLKVADLARRLKIREIALTMYARASHGYALDGMLLKAIAVCKIILDIDPKHRETLETLAKLYTEQYGAAPKELLEEHKGESEVTEEFFGDTRLTSDAPLNHLADTAEDEIAIIDDDDITIIDTEDEDIDDEELILELPPLTATDKNIPKVPLFSDLSRESFIDLINYSEVKEFTDKEPIVEEGTEGNSFFVVVSGAVSIEKSDTQIATLDEGGFFGEMALVSKAPRRASVAALGQCQVMEITSDYLDKLKQKYPAILDALSNFATERLLHNLFLTSPLFTPFSFEERKSLILKFVHKRYEQHDYLIRKGEPVEGLFLIVAGGALVIDTDVSGNNIQIATLKEGDIAGEMSLLTYSSATASVKASCKTTALCLPRGAFTEVIMTHPQILEIVSLISEKRQADNRDILSRKIASSDDGGSAPL